VGGGISVGTGSSVGDETSRRNGLRGTGGTGGTGGAGGALRIAQPRPGISVQAAGVTGGGALEGLDFASFAACT
jgi:hypothetical protein